MEGAFLRAGMVLISTQAQSQPFMISLQSSSLHVKVLYTLSVKVCQ